MTEVKNIISTDMDDYIGRVVSVDTNRALIIAESPEIIQKLTVSDLVAISGNTPQEYLIGLIEKVKRTLGSTVNDIGLIDDAEEDAEISNDVGYDIIQVALIGTNWDLLGGVRSVS
ncbi:hypothetical protein [Aeromonas sp. 1HA1]|uniref:hypothetical protein n=1 Tax=Aeromonas sp. 1HA1 TaxID=2699193 RepID=UPI0023DD76DB|nr:hypothetical protein [Aeromonas sp. 1HA1]MDF2414272.1 hypothetical protein [Aeromonas sp. 1HA1]